MGSHIGVQDDINNGIYNDTQNVFDSTQKVLSLDNYGDLMSAKDLSIFLGISKQTVYKEIRDGKFGTPLKFGREYRIPKLYISRKYFHV